jgi:hypothetical protein
MSVLISIKDADALNDNADFRRGLMVMCPSRQFRQLGDVGGRAGVAGRGDRVASGVLNEFAAVVRTGVLHKRLPGPKPAQPLPGTPITQESLRLDA